MFEINKYCDYLYHSLYIPVYLYENKELLACYPAQKEITLPPAHYLTSLMNTNQTISYIMTYFYSYYGCIKLEYENDKDYYLIIGPVNDFPYTNDSLMVMYREFSVAATKKVIFNNFIYNIPTQNLESFVDTLLFINYTLNKTELTRKDIDAYGSNLFDSSIKRTFSEKSYESREECKLSINFDNECELMRYIENGNVKALQNFINGAQTKKPSTIRQNTVRHWKDIFLVTVTLTSRAAIKGGLTPSNAYQLADVYIIQADSLSDIDSIKSLMIQLELDYTKRVADAKIPTGMDSIMYKVIRYIRENTNNNLTVAYVADKMGFSRTYLSRKFKKELGIELSSFIRYCKLDEAKDLLIYSEKSISEISNYLYFSSQSHFQKAFKNRFGITPQTFRKSM